MEINIVKWFQSFSSQPLDTFFSFVSKFGEVIPFVVIFLLFYWFLNKETAMKFMFVTLVGALLNSGFKRLIKRPRPYVNNADIIDNKYGSIGYSFPSGHSVFATLTFGGQYCALKSKLNKTAHIVNLLASICIILLVMISRVYLGQHYLSDVVCGVLFGILWLLVGNEIFNYIEKYFKHILIAIIPVILLFVLLKENPFVVNEIYSKYYILGGAIIGVIVGYLLDFKLIKNNNKLTLKQNFLKLFINILITAVCTVVVITIKANLIFQMLLFFMLALILTFGCSLINKLIFKVKEVN